jgi:hypothetical protein
LVSLAGDDPPVQGLDFLHGLGQVLACRHRVRHGADLVAEVDRDDVRALLRQPNRVAAALAPHRAGDEGDLALELSRHIFLPFAVRSSVGRSSLPREPGRGSRSVLGRALKRR